MSLCNQFWNLSFQGKGKAGSVIPGIHSFQEKDGRTDVIILEIWSSKTKEELMR
jgi:hypothetical protein